MIRVKKKIIETSRFGYQLIYEIYKKLVEPS